MTQRYLLGIDAGQTTVKAVLHDERLRPVAVGRRASPVRSDSPRVAERSQDELWEACAGAIADALTGIDPTCVAAVGIAGHGDGLHLVDAQGHAVGPAITAMDSRAWREVELILADAVRRDTILRVTGQSPVASSPGALLAWTRAHRPDRLERASAMLSCKDVIRLRLTGDVATDYSDACASFLDVHSATWSTEALAAYGLSEYRHLLPEIRSGIDPGGVVSPEAASRTGLIAGTPVVTGVHDVQAAAIGMGALSDDQLGLVAGSFSTNGVTTRRTDVDPRWQSRLSLDPRVRIAMSTSPTASPMLEWALQTTGGDRDRIFAEAAALDPEASVPRVLPYLHASPLGADATATVAGLRGDHTRAHLFRGVLEGIALMHAWHIGALEERFDTRHTVLLGGGLAHSPLYVQLVANALRRPVQVVVNDEAGAFGAAAIAAVAAGIFADIDLAQDRVQRSEPVYPTAESADYWAGVRASWDGLAEALAPWWKMERHRSTGGPQ